MLPDKGNYISLDAKDPKKLNRKVSEGSSLDNTSITCRSLKNRKKRKARFWNRILSFITRLKSRKIKGYRFAFLTLTSSPQSNNEKILNHWNTLKKRIERKYGKVYAFAVREFNKGGDLIHLHLLLYASYIPQSWISTNWNDIHKANIVYIQGIKETKLKGKVLGYLAKYVSKEFSRSLNIRRFTYSYFFHALSSLWKAYVSKFLEVYGYNHVKDMIKWWNYYITVYDDWNYPKAEEYINSIRILRELP